MVWRKPFAEKASQIGKIDPNAIRWFDRLGRQHAIKDINRPAGDKYAGGYTQTAFRVPVKI